MTLFIALAFVGVLVSLATALVFMVRKPPADKPDAPKTSPMAKALAFRIGISVVLFISILVSWKLGWIHPSGIPLTPA